MQVADFGRFEGPVALFGGPYSNLQALEALAVEVGERPAICTGDIVAYGGDPAATVERMRALGWPSIAGNCERQIAEGAEDCGCGFADGSTCDRLSAAWYPFARDALDAEAVGWMAALPQVATFQQGDRRYGVLHGSATDISRYIWPDEPESTFRAEIAALEALVGRLDGVVAGHSGIAFQRDVGRHRWINAGVIGMPPHDGRPEVRYAVLEDGEAVIHRLSYDHTAACRAMEAAGLTQGYHAALESGIWPSEEVLPQSLKR